MANQQIEALIGRLVSTHGEGGTCPTAEDWRRIFAVGDGRPVCLVNLLRFRARVDGPEGTLTGAEAYRRYSGGISGAFARSGGELQIFGGVAYGFGDGPDERWDVVVVTRYPSADALARLWLDPEFIAAHAHRAAGVERSQVLVLDP